MFSPLRIARHPEPPREHHSTRHSIAVFAARSAGPQPHPNFFIFLLLLLTWCLGESIPTDDESSRR